MRRNDPRNSPGVQYSHCVVGLLGNSIPCSESDSEESETSAMQHNVLSPSISELSEYKKASMPQVRIEVFMLCPWVYGDVIHARRADRSTTACTTYFWVDCT